MEPIHRVLGDRALPRWLQTESVMYAANTIGRVLWPSFCRRRYAVTTTVLLLSPPFCHHHHRFAVVTVPNPNSPLSTRPVKKIHASVRSSGRNDRSLLTYPPSGILADCGSRWWLYGSDHSIKCQFGMVSPLYNYCNLYLILIWLRGFFGVFGGVGYFPAMILEEEL